MSSWLDIIAYLNWIDRVEGIISSFLNADWRGATHHHGGTGWSASLVAQSPAAIVGESTCPRDCDWSGGEIEQFLAHYGVKVWGRGFAGEDIYFSVKERQANWAEYLLRRRGIPVSNRLFNARNDLYAEQHAPGDQPPAWADGPHDPNVNAAQPDFLDKIGRWFG